MGIAAQSLSEPATRRRLAAVDALRGLALFGMLVVHVQYYADGPPIWADRIQTAIDALFTERFWALFAFLFGVGFALQIERWEDKPGFVRIYLRRLLILAGFAIVIAAFTGYRVLLGYAFWGLVLLAMRRWSDRALVVAAVVIALAAPAISAVRWQIEKRTIGVEASNQKAARERGIWRAANQEETRIKQEGTFPQLMKHRLRFELGAFCAAHLVCPGRGSADVRARAAGGQERRASRSSRPPPAAHRRGGWRIDSAAAGRPSSSRLDRRPGRTAAAAGRSDRRAVRHSESDVPGARVRRGAAALDHSCARHAATLRLAGARRPDVADQLRRANLRAGVAVHVVSA